MNKELLSVEEIKDQDRECQSHPVSGCPKCKYEDNCVVACVDEILPYVEEIAKLRKESSDTNRTLLSVYNKLYAGADIVEVIDIIENFINKPEATEDEESGRYKWD